jgi:hypothetical protein
LPEARPIERREERGAGACRELEAHSKKFANHCHALALYVFYYNWIRQHASLRVSPAMAAGLTNKLLNREDLVALMDAAEASQANNLSN